MDEPTEEDKFKQVIHYRVAKICEELKESSAVSFSKQTIATIAEVTYRQAQLLAEDLECFARHAKRKRVTSDDVMLCVRRSLDLQKHLKELKNNAPTKK